VVGGAELFLAGVLGAAGRLRISAFSLTALVSGFELENLAAGIAANAKGLPGAAAGTFLGGTTFLALGVTGLGGAIAPISARLPWKALACTAVSPVPLVLLSLDGLLSRLDGALLVAWFVVAIGGLSHAGRSLPTGPPARRPRGAVVRLLGGLALLTAGGALLGEGMRRTVSRLGISEALLGNTAVAASVEAEELARVAVPARRGRGEVALGNVAGTVVHFVGLNAGLIALVQPLALDDETRHFYLPAALAATLVLCALLGRRHGITRGAGLGLLGLYVAYVAAAIAVAAS
jgi:cation:H+ antiporter